MNVNKTEKIEKYQFYIQKFINGIMEDKLLKNSSLIYLFFSTKNEKDFISIMEKYDKAPRPNSLKYFYSRDGKIILDENILKKPEKNKLLDIKSNISKNNYIFDNLNKSLKMLCKEIKQRKHADTDSNTNPDGHYHRSDTEPHNALQHSKED